LSHTTGKDSVTRNINRGVSVYKLLPPFSRLFLGIGVDDLFVIVQTWDNVYGAIDDKEPIPYKMSRTMRHAVSSLKQFGE